MIPPVVTDILLLLLLLLVLWLVLRPAGKSRDRDTERLDYRLEEQARHIQQLEERLGELKLAQQEAGYQLREKLVGAFSELREELYEMSQNPLMGDTAYHMYLWLRR